MFERFTERARQVIVLAQEEARNADRGYIGPEYILLGLLREDTGLAARVLASMDVTADKVRELATEYQPPARDEERESNGQIPFTPRAKSCLELSLREALSFGHNYIGTEHVLLGLLREGDNNALTILHEHFKLESERIRSEVIRMLSGPKAPILQKDPQEQHPFRAGQEVGIKRESFMSDDLLNLIVLLARQHPEVASDKIVAAAKVLV